MKMFVSSVNKGHACLIQRVFKEMTYNNNKSGHKIDTCGN